MTPMLLCFILLSIATATISTPETANITGFRCGFPHIDFYYRAIAASYLRVVYYSSDNSNILEVEALSAIHNIEQQIKAWPGYDDRSLIYKDLSDSAKSFFAGLGLTNLYCQSVPISATNFIFPELYNQSAWFTGAGKSIYNDWKQWIKLFGDDEFYFDAETFTLNNDYESSFIASAYPFGYMDSNETKDSHNQFVLSYDELLSSITSDKIQFSWSYNYRIGVWPDSVLMGFPGMVAVNDKKYQHMSTPAPTFAPTANNTGFTPQNVSSCYQFGYRTNSWLSDGAVNHRSVQTPVPTQAPTVAQQARDPHGHTMRPTEWCRKTFWPKYEVEDEPTDAIYYDNYRWNMIDGDKQYHCNVLFRDILLCRGQWKDSGTGEFVDLSVTEFIATDGAKKRITFVIVHACIYFFVFLMT